jgi:hypothetical protein
MAEDEERDLGDIVLSWSVRQIMDDDHYKGQVLDRRALGCGCLYGGCRHERFGCVLLSFFGGYFSLSCVLGSVCVMSSASYFWFGGSVNPCGCVACGVLLALIRPAPVSVIFFWKRTVG